MAVVGNLHHAGSDELAEWCKGAGDIVIVRELLDLSTDSASVL